MIVFTWADFLNVADVLMRQGDEAPARSAISRAYYAVFGTARDHLISGGRTIPRTGQAHALVWDAFHAVPDRTHRRIANLGRRLLTRRHHADYELVYTNVMSDAASSVAAARQILDDLASLR